MIKIIRQGDKKRCTCPNCACIFTYEKEDVVTKPTGCNEYESFVNCPCCAEKINAKLVCMERRNHD